MRFIYLAIVFLALSIQGCAVYPTYPYSGIVIYPKNGYRHQNPGPPYRHHR